MVGYKSKGAVCNWENGANFPDYDKLELLLGILEIDANTLYGWPSGIKNDADELAKEILADPYIKKIMQQLLTLKSEDKKLALILIERMGKNGDKNDN